MRMIWIFTLTALSLFSTLDNINTPCSVKAEGSFLLPPQLDVAFCDFKFSNSSFVNWNIKSAGNLSIFPLSCSFNRPVGPWYSSARSSSNITFCPLRRYILVTIISSATIIDLFAFAIRFSLRIANLFFYLTHRVMILQLAFEVVQCGELVALRRADVFVAGHVLHLAQIVCLQPVGDDAAAELCRINDPRVKPAELLDHQLHPVVDIGRACRLLSAVDEQRPGLEPVGLHIFS